MLDFDKMEYLDLLEKAYFDSFFNTLKSRALNLWISIKDREEMCTKTDLWMEYTDFFEKSMNEYFTRCNEWFDDTTWLLPPDTWNLEFQITEDIIKKVYIEYILEKWEHWSSLLSMDVMKLYKLYKNDLLLNHLIEEYPIEIYKKQIPFKYDENNLKSQYLSSFNIPKYPNKNSRLDFCFEANIRTNKWPEIYLEMKNNFQKKETILETVKKYSQFIWDLFNYFLSRTCDNEYQNHNEFETLLLDFFDKYNDDVINDEELSNLFAKYILMKMKFYNKRYNWIFKKDYKEWNEIKEGIKTIYHTNPLFEWGKHYDELFVTENKIKDFINRFWNNNTLYESLNIYSMIYFDIWNRSDRENYIKEAIYRMKKISSDNNTLVLWLKEYLSSLLTSTFLIDFKWEKKPLYFDEIADDLKEIFWEKEFLEFKAIFKKSYGKNKWDEIIRQKYKIWLIFWDIRSKKAFEIYCNDNRSNKEFSDRQIEKRQFEILAEEYHEQQSLNIENKLEKWIISFVLIFEMDHETKLRNLLPLYPNRLIVCNIPGQHFSHTQFLNMLDIWLKNFEK